MSSLDPVPLPAPDGGDDLGGIGGIGEGVGETSLAATAADDRARVLALHNRLLELEALVHQNGGHHDAAFDDDPFGGDGRPDPTAAAAPPTPPV